MPILGFQSSHQTTITKVEEDSSQREVEVEDSDLALTISMIPRGSSKEPHSLKEVEVAGEVETHIKLAIEISTTESVLVTQLTFRRPNRGLEEEVRGSSLQTMKLNGSKMTFMVTKLISTKDPMHT